MSSLYASVSLVNTMCGSPVRAAGVILMSGRDRVELSWAASSSERKMSQLAAVESY
jgi:hypothetical protein